MKLYLQRKRFDVDFCYPLVPAEDSTGFPLKARFRFQNPEVLLPQLVPKRLSAHRRFEAQKTPPNPISLSLSFSTRIFRENLLKLVPTGELFCPRTKPEPDFSSTTSGFYQRQKRQTEKPCVWLQPGTKQVLTGTGFIRWIYYLTPNSPIYSSVQLIGNHKLFSRLCTFIFSTFRQRFPRFRRSCISTRNPPKRKINLRTRADWSWYWCFSSGSPVRTSEPFREVISHIFIA